jgi:phage terminase small subunit|tara:strand:+ start:717 stop:1259 length:543 start_codon:yes stop_codon:yes gene_type:complete
MRQLKYTSLVPTEDGSAFIDDKGKVWQPLNSKQKKFCREYLKGQTATDSAIKAGYTKDRKGAKTQGSVLLNHNPMVRNYLIDLEITASQKDAISLENHLSTLHDLREEAKDQGQISAAITAEVHRGKAGGLYIDRREILTAKIDLMSKDDILTRLEDLIKKRATLIEGEVIREQISNRDS